jgi:hypothetical protein
MARTSSPKYRSALLTLIRRPSVEYELLKLHWPQAVRHLKQQHRQLRDKIGRETPDDPILSNCDLFASIDRESDERLHTPALAYLFNDKNPHEFGTHILQSVLAKMPHGSGARKIAALLQHKRLTLKIDPEFGYSSWWPASSVVPTIKVP